MSKEHYQANTYPFGLLISSYSAPTCMCCQLKNQYFIACKTWALEQPDASVPSKKLEHCLGKWRASIFKAPHLVWAPKNPHAMEGLKIRTLTNHITLKQWTYSSTFWSLMAPHLAVGRFIEND
jgi:hypothetical protein